MKLILKIKIHHARNKNANMKNIKKRRERKIVKRKNKKKINKIIMLLHHNI
jgi:hypothetical protein